jgi:ParB family chromosome partitioning protein
LLGAADQKARTGIWRDVVKRKLSVRDTEVLVRKAAASVAGGGPPSVQANARRDAEVADIEARLRRALSTRVTVTPQKKGARITIDCYSAEEFENVVGMLLNQDAPA